MSAVSSIPAAMDAIASKKERLHKAFVDLESHTSALTNFTLQWKELEEHFEALEQAMRQRFQELQDKEEDKAKSKAKASPPKAAAASANKKTLETSTAASVKTPEATPRPQLKSLCEKMDAEGLRKFIVDARKDIAAIRAEAPAALRFAANPAKLVLKSIEGFYPADQLAKTDKKDSALPAHRRASILLLEALVPALADSPPSSEAKEQAKNVASDWKSKINLENDAGTGNSLEAHAFLQLLASFGVASHFNKNDLCDLVIAIARRKQTPDLCRALGLEEKMPDVVEKLVNSGKQIEAVNFAHAFGLVEKFPPVPLLKAYLKDAKKASQETLKSGNNSTAAQNEATSKELSSLRAVIKCIEEHKLESQFSSENLEKRVAQLEKAKADRKRSAVAIKSQPKRPRANGGSAGAFVPPPSVPERTPNVFASSSATERSFLRPVDRGQYPAAAAGVASYTLTGQGTYDRASQSQGIYGSAYGVGSRSPVSLSRSHLYPSENLQSSLLGAGTYNASTNYGSYSFGSSLPPPSSAYQSPFFH